MKKKVLVWLSGWVDSAVSAYLLKKEGYDVTAGFMINYRDPENPNCPTRIDKIEAKKVAQFLEIPFLELDFVEDYTDKVLNYMYDWYKKWITPNPDIMCNKEVKFKVFLEEAEKRWFDEIAMGHYARIEEENGIFKLLKWVDENKDQSYFLAWLSQEQLSKALFPIGHLEKPEVRKIAEEIGLPNAKRKDSQGICFVWKVKMADFLEKKIKPKPWLVKDTSWNILWEHKWVFYYTIGQRKGLDIWGQSEPIFVVKKDIEKNEIIVWTSKDLELYSDSLEMNNINFLNPKYKEFFQPSSQPSPLGEKEQEHNIELKAKCKIRYRQADQDCEIIATSPLAPLLSWEGKLKDLVFKVKFKEKQRAIASGQICAVYIGEELVMSGVIM